MGRRLSEGALLKKYGPETILSCEEFIDPL